MKVFLDTNVIIDFYAQREEFYRPASIIIDLAKRKEILDFIFVIINHPIITTLMQYPIKPI